MKLVPLAMYLFGTLGECCENGNVPIWIKKFHKIMGTWGCIRMETYDFWLHYESQLRTF